MAVKRIRPAIYHYYPRGFQKDHLRMREEGYKTEVTFMPESESDSIYVQLFDLKFEIPPSQMFLPDAKMDPCKTIGLDTQIHVLSDATVKLEMYFMQYKDKERVSNKRFKLTLNPGVNQIEESIPQVEGAEYFKLSYKYVIETTEPRTIRLDDLYLSFEE
ncbi:MULTISPECIES: hypothetical protein [Exiguobacterium]|jgi:hypothetical protein|uniref:hypothetical protein n=1 Tax=Exiguobacterium TaxID=33986 RepID=UPI0005139ECA|nr:MULTISPECIES: hypothetical protein [unclassified Exiguobacterium]KGI86215.1 hypothetical protein JY98_08180 [Exiguobacterium mexicanum]